jgi:hypothetical protein
LDEKVVAFIENMLQVSLKEKKRGVLGIGFDESSLSELENSYVENAGAAKSSESPTDGVNPPNRPSLGRGPTAGNNNPLFQNRTPQQRANFNNSVEKGRSPPRTGLHIDQTAALRAMQKENSRDSSQERGRKQQSSAEDTSENAATTTTTIAGDGLTVNTQPLSRASSGFGGDYKDVYHVPANLKYMPVDMINTSGMKKSIARNLLYSALKGGMSVIKHGRQGKPKRRILTCDSNVTLLFWLPETSQTNDVEQLKEGKSINISDVLDIREGVEIDPETSSAALTAAAATGTISPDKLMDLVKAKEELKSLDRKPSQKPNIFETIFGSKEKDGILLGTFTLRKNCKADEFKLCFSLILPDR